MPPRDNVPWDRLWVYAASADAPRDARRVPQLVRRIAGLRGSRRVRSAALWELEVCLEHQGGLSPATVHVIPRLFAILRDRPGRPWQRRSLLSLLSLFAVPQPGNLFPALVDPSTDYAALDPRCFHATADREVARACFVAVEEGAPTIAHLIEDPSARVACEAIGLLSLFRRHADATLRALDVRHRAPAVLACAIVARARLGGEAPAALVDHADPLVRYAAACARVLAGDHAARALLSTPPADDLAPFAFGGSWAAVGAALASPAAPQRPT